MAAAQKIIIAEDDHGIQEVIRLILEGWGYEVIIYRSGLDLIHNKFEVPHLFILDKQLADIDGLDVCKWLKENPATRHIPVIMVSTSPHISKFALKAGADNFLEKPFKMQELKELVEKALL
ncbi:response regulator [Flavihumibacter solisilvae]|uniref:Response regulatory domain-containing protein n=1 Tax=Flavihumibacter solisilvae TaxID=1349421 RepID=A0A0C1IYV8_9BACT|nr:response regulator [Flavihumibacter solisilvae]KIC95659.1 hypothetical protein OI18_05280 [Flavihumibacter solisilvae]